MIWKTARRGATLLILRPCGLVGGELRADREAELYIRRNETLINCRRCQPSSRHLYDELLTMRKTSESPMD